MLTIYGVKVSAEALLGLFFFVFFSWSEYLGGSKKIKSNSITELLYNSLRRNRNEDDKIARIVKILKEND